MPKRKYRRRAKQEIAAAPTPMAIVGSPFASPSDMRPTPDGASSIAAVTTILQALTDLPSDRAKARALQFVEDIFAELHGH